MLLSKFCDTHTHTHDYYTSLCQPWFALEVSLHWTPEVPLHLTTSFLTIPPFPLLSVFIITCFPLPLLPFPSPPLPASSPPTLIINDHPSSPCIPFRLSVSPLDCTSACFQVPRHDCYRWCERYLPQEVQSHVNHSPHAGAARLLGGGDACPGIHCRLGPWLLTVCVWPSSVLAVRCFIAGTLRLAYNQKGCCC